MPGEEFLDGYFGLLEGVCQRNSGGGDDLVGDMPGGGVLADGGLDAGGEFVGEVGVVGEHDEQRHVVAAVGLFGSHDKGVENLGHRLKCGLDVGAAQTYPAAVE